MVVLIFFFFFRKTKDSKAKSHSLWFGSSADLYSQGSTLSAASIHTPQRS